MAPWTIDHTDQGNGSLTKAVNMAVDSGIINEAKWVGIVAMPSDDVSLRVKNDISDKLSKEFACEAVFPDDVTFEGHYKSFCKQILWPTLHYQIPDDPKSKAFEDHSWGHYVLMNELIADKIVETYNKLDDEETKVWIHDYHLLLVPKWFVKNYRMQKLDFSCMFHSLLLKFSVALLKEINYWKGCWELIVLGSKPMNMFVISCKLVIVCCWQIPVNWVLIIMVISQ